MSSQEALVERLEKVCDRLEALATKLGKNVVASALADVDSDDDSTPASVSAWQQLMDEHLPPLLEAMKSIDGEFESLTKSAYDNITALIAAAPSCKKPTPEALLAFLKPACDAIAAAQSKDTRGATGLHAQAFAEWIQGIAWVTVEPAPRGIVEAQLQAADFYLNKVLVATKEADDKEVHRAFVNGCRALLKDVMKYIKAFQTTGIVYNGAGVALSEFGK
ncbi:MAG: hypothetical protein MHM6MM_004994 [Cercozoa sp. M6MM]